MQKRSNDWLRDNVGKDLTFAFGKIQYTEKLRFNETLGIFYFKVRGTDFDARICEIQDL